MPNLSLGRCPNAFIVHCSGSLILVKKIGRGMPGHQLRADQPSSRKQLLMAPHLAMYFG